MKIRGFVFFLVGLALIGCGTRPERERGPEADYYDLTGAWEMYSVDNKNPAVTTCKDVLYMNTDHTFSRSYSCSAQGRTLNNDAFSGYYEVIGSKIQFNYVHAPAEIFDYFLVGNELRLVKNDQAIKYYRKPNDAP